VDLEDIRGQRLEWHFVGGMRLGGRGGRYVPSPSVWYEISEKSRTAGFCHRPKGGQRLWIVELAGIRWGVSTEMGFFLRPWHIVFADGGTKIGDFHRGVRRILTVDGLNRYCLISGRTESRWVDQRRRTVATCHLNQAANGPRQLGSLELAQEVESTHAPVIAALSLVLAARSGLFFVGD
jgi:hypothetical protein